MHGRGACMVGGMRGGGVHDRGVCMAGETATAADGTHRTGMYSCLSMHLCSLIIWKSVGTGYLEGKSNSQVWKDVKEKVPMTFLVRKLKINISIVKPLFYFCVQKYFDRRTRLTAQNNKQNNHKSYLLIKCPSFKKYM